MVSNTNDSGPGSFRQALLNANASNGTDTITFQLPGSGVQTISPLSRLPALVDSTRMDGTTQPGYLGQPLIELEGSNAGSTPGLRLVAPNCVIRGLAINRFGGSGIQIDGSGTNFIQANYIGLDPAGLIARPNAGEGVWINGASANIVGGTNASDRNVISGNGGSGIYLLNGGLNWIQGNFIGTTSTGDAALANAQNGVVIYHSASNQIGGIAVGARNVISGNRASGVYLVGLEATANCVQGNYIGLSVNGRAALKNFADGVTILDVSRNLIGGTNAGEGNVISGNGQAGVSISGSQDCIVQGSRIGTDAEGRAGVGNVLAGVWLANSHGIKVGGSSPEAHNVISGNRQDGIFIFSNSFDNAISGNFIGVDVTGTNALANSYNGISLNGAVSNRIGGVEGSAGNVLSGNSHYGLALSSGANANTVQGNRIGSDSSGFKPVRNVLSGVRIETTGNCIGGTSPEARNLISGNGQDGVFLVGGNARSNIIEGNYVGTTVEGAAALPNGRAGIGVSAAPYNQIGGCESGAGNLLSANTEAGLYLIENSATGNQILGNHIGTDTSGIRPLGNGYEGIYLENAPGNTIGSSTPGAENTISANHTRGIWLTNSSGNRIEGNRIGTTSDGLTPLGNTFHNLECEAGSSDNVIGGVGRAGNNIGFAQSIYAGVRIRNGSFNNRICGNLIFGNGGLGIDLGPVGVSPNDHCDLDDGANRLQNFPVLTQAVNVAGLAVRGALDSAAGRPCILQFFGASSGQDSSGIPVFLGETTVIPGAGCTGSFVIRLPIDVPDGYLVTATATDAQNNTSEFSAPIAIWLAPRLEIIPAQSGAAGLSWTNNPGGFVLKQASSLSPPVHWIAVTNLPVLRDGNLQVIVSPGPKNRFYALDFE